MIIKEQFEESLFREDVIEYYLSKSRKELEEEFGIEVAMMKDYDQMNSHHCYNLLEHTLHTVYEIPVQNLNANQARLLKVAAFFHDVGKPSCAFFNEKTGQQAFYGHPLKSALIARPILEQLGYVNEELEKILFFIEHHDDFISYKKDLALWMHNHLFMRDINTASILEKLIENKYNFKDMEYNEEQVRVICYMLAHNYQIPNFTSKGIPLTIKFNMKEVEDKIKTGKFANVFVANLDDYKLLLTLCKADALAQSEIALQNRKEVGNKKEKLANIEKIEKLISESYLLLNEI